MDGADEMVDGADEMVDDSEFVQSMPLQLSYAKEDTDCRGSESADLSITQGVEEDGVSTAPPDLRDSGTFGSDSIYSDALFCPSLDDMVMEVEIDGRQTDVNNAELPRIPELREASPVSSVNSSCDGGGSNSAYSSPSDSPDVTRSRNRRFHSDLCDAVTGLPVSEDIRHGYRMLKELMAPSLRQVNAMFMTELDPTDDASIFYMRNAEVLTLYSIKEKFENSLYASLTDSVRDFRNMLENYIRYFGPDHSSLKKCEKFETMLEQKMALLSRKFHSMTTIAQTHMEFMTSEEPNLHWAALAAKNKSLTFTSALMSYLRQESREKGREQRKQNLIQKEKERESYNHEIACWEAALFTDNDREQMLSSWELPQIGLFLYLCQEPLNCGSICQYAVERMALLCRESEAMGLVMTSLLSTPYQRQYLDRRPLMPYDVWSMKLNRRLDDWYKILAESGWDFDAAACKIGIETMFWHVAGRLRNPLGMTTFHELTYYQRNWIVKSLCDSCMFTQNSLREAVDGQTADEARSYLLGADSSGATYIHFPQFCGDHLRVYKINSPKKAGRGRRPANNPVELTDTDSNLSAGGAGTPINRAGSPVDVCTVQSSHTTPPSATLQVAPVSSLRGRRKKQRTPPSPPEDGDDSNLRFSARALRLAKRSERFYYEAASRFKAAGKPSLISEEDNVKNSVGGSPDLDTADSASIKLEASKQTDRAEQSNGCSIQLEPADADSMLPQNADCQQEDSNVSAECRYKSDDNNVGTGAVPQTELTPKLNANAEWEKRTGSDPNLKIKHVNDSIDFDNAARFSKPGLTLEPTEVDESTEPAGAEGAGDCPETSVKILEPETNIGSNADLAERLEPEMDLLVNSGDTQTYRLICQTVEDLRQLCQQFSGSTRGREADLHERLYDLLTELTPWESKLLSLDKKAKDKLKKEQEDYVEPSEAAHEVNGDWDTDDGEEDVSSADGGRDVSDEESAVATDKTDTEYVPPIKERRPKRDKMKIKEEKEKVEETEFGVSVFGRKRKRRVIPNNTEADPFVVSRKKSKKERECESENPSPPDDVTKTRNPSLSANVTKINTLPTLTPSPTSGNLQTLQIPDGFVLVKINKQMYLVPKAKLPALLSQPQNAGIQIINKGVKVVSPPSMTALAASLKAVSDNAHQSKPSLPPAPRDPQSLLPSAAAKKTALINPAILKNSLLGQAAPPSLRSTRVVSQFGTRLYTSPLIDPAGSRTFTATKLSSSNTASTITVGSNVVSGQTAIYSQPPSSSIQSAVSVSSIAVNAATASSAKPQVVEVTSRKSSQNKPAFYHFNPSLSRMPFRSPIPSTSRVLYQPATATAKPQMKIAAAAQPRSIMPVSAGGAVTTMMGSGPPQVSHMEVTVDSAAFPQVTSGSLLLSADQGGGGGTRSTAPPTSAVIVGNPSLSNQIIRSQSSAQIKLHISPQRPDRNELNSRKQLDLAVRTANNKSIQIILPPVQQRFSLGGQPTISTTGVSVTQQGLRYVSPANSGNITQRININNSSRPQFVVKPATRRPTQQLPDNVTLQVSTSQGIQYIPVSGSHASKIIHGAVIRQTASTIRQTVPAIRQPAPSVRQPIRRTIPHIVHQTRAPTPIIQIQNNRQRTLVTNSVVQGVRYTAAPGLTASNTPNTVIQGVAVRPMSAASGNSSVPTALSLSRGAGGQPRPSVNVNPVQGSKHLIVLRNANGKFYLPQVINSESLPAPVRVTTVHSSTKRLVEDSSSTPSGEALTGADNSTSELLPKVNNSIGETFTGAGNSTDEPLTGASNPTGEPLTGASNSTGEPLTATPPMNR